MYRRSLHPRWRELAASIIVIAVLLPVTSFLAGDARAPGEQYWDELQGEDLRDIYLVRHGWHAGIVVRRADVPDVLLPEKRDFPAGRFLEIGWGDAGFYRNRTYSLGLTARALFLPTESIVHIVGLDRPPQFAFPQANVVRLSMPVGRFHDLLLFLDGSIDRDNRERAIRAAPGRYGHSYFYKGMNSYHAFRTCNNWAVRALARAGIPVRTTMTLTAGDAMDEARRYGVSLRHAEQPSLLDMALRMFF